MKQVKQMKNLKSYGYKKVDLKDKWGRIWGVEYKNTKQWISIKIDFIDAEICTETLDDESEPVYIKIQELKAINMKCKELGWE